MDSKKIKKLLEEKARNRVRVSLSLDADNFKELESVRVLHSKNLPDNKKLTMSDMVDTTIQMALADPYFSLKEINEEEDFE